MLLLTGPPGSGVTSHILAEFRQALRRNASNVRLLVPTATMAEHLRHKLAREGFVFRPSLIQTLSKFVSSWVEDLPQISPAQLYLLVEEIARKQAPVEFARVLEAPGFHAALAQTIEEFSSVGCDSSRLRRFLPQTEFANPFANVYSGVERELARRGWALRAARFERAAQRMAKEGLPGLDTFWMDGFFALTEPELAVIRSICGHADLTVTLPNLEGPNPTREALLAFGFEERRVESVFPAVTVRAFSASTCDREAEEICRNILAENIAGADFRDIGIIVRNPDIYVAPFKAALERFGIPARFYFADRLHENPAVRYLSGIVSALLSGWDHAATLAALRLLPDVSALDQFDFKVREQLPGRGLDELKALTEDTRLLRILGDLGALDSWGSASLTASKWAQRLASLRSLIHPGIAEPTRAEAGRLRAQASALKAYEAALTETAGFLGDDHRIMLAEFWNAAQAVFRLSPLRISDQRRDVVHVLSVFEARQWELPIVFVCGLAEQEFPKRQTQDPFFPDNARRQLARSGIRLRASDEIEREERFLFDLAASRATRKLTLSFAEADTRGAGNLPSEFIAHPIERRNQLSRPESRAKAAADPAGRFNIIQHKFSASGLECFLDCPFQFFARYTLKLRTRPLLPQARLDFMLQGTIVHETLAEWHRAPQPIEPLFERTFAKHCEAKAVFPGYRAETLRRQMLDDLRQFSEKVKLPASDEIFTEQPFEIVLEDSLVLRGRIDRVDKLPGNLALIVDYKYSAAQRVAARLKKETLLQGGLYAMAVERQMNLKPVGVFYFGLKKDLKVVGWSDPPGRFEIDSEPLTREWIENAVATARSAAAAIRNGRVGPDPLDLDLCSLCEYRDVCRYDGAGRALTKKAPAS